MTILISEWPPVSELRKANPIRITSPDQRHSQRPLRHLTHTVNPDRASSTAFRRCNGVLTVWNR